MLKKLLSRKLWVAVAYGLLVYANRKYQLGLNTEDMLTIAGVSGAYIFGEAYIDAKKLYRP